MDIIREWTETLESKGIVLAPASALQHVPEVAPAEPETPIAEAPDTTPSLP